MNFAIHLPLFDKLFGTFHLPPGHWPQDYGIPEEVPRDYLAQQMYPFTRKAPAKTGGEAA